MSDNTANWYTCPDCGNLINPKIGHACSGIPWKTITQSGMAITALETRYILDDEIKEYLRRIAEAMEKIAIAYTPPEFPHLTYEQKQEFLDKFRETEYGKQRIAKHGLPQIAETPKGTVSNDT